MTVLSTPERVSGLFTREGAPVPLLGIEYRAQVRGSAVELAVAQRFRNQEAKPLEVTYVFPLPEGAAICGFTISLPDGEIEGAVEEREKAFDRYDAAVAEGHGAFLLDQERPNVFQLSVGNLLPGEEAEITLRYVELAALVGADVALSPAHCGGLPLRIPPEGGLCP